MFKHLVAHEDGDDGGGGDDVDDNDDDVKDLEPPGGVERLVAGEAAEAVSVIVTACCDHLFSREYLPRIARKIGIVFHHHYLDDDDDEDDAVARNGSFMIHNDENNYDDHDDTLPEHLGQVPNTASPKIEVVSKGVDFVFAFFPNRSS